MSWLYFNLPYKHDCTSFFYNLLSYDCPIWLDSCAHATVGRYDILSAAPAKTVELNQNDTILINKKGTVESDKDFIDILKSNISLDVAQVGDFMFSGALGYFSYEFGVKQHRLKCQNESVHEMPQAWFGLYNWAVIIDHHLKAATLVYRNISNLERDIKQIKIFWLASNNTYTPNTKFSLTQKFKSNISRDEYQSNFSKIKQNLYKGDTYQVNYSHCFSAPFKGDAFDAYVLLRQKNPSQFAVFLRLEQGDVLSFSPELLVHGESNNLQTKPIKGTAARTFNNISDDKIKMTLKTCSKNRAENLMIVDLLRNDLSKIADVSSVNVDDLFKIETLPSVFHLVSTVSAKLDRQYDYFDVLKAVLPGGSITGAPKYRTMQLIEQYEKYQRSLYCGSIGYLSVNTNMCFNIAIRTMISANGQLYCSVGGGIVIDSNCKLEYQETLDKVSLITNTLNNISNV